MLRLERAVAGPSRNVAPQLCGPALRRLVIDGAVERRPRPEIDLHDVDVAFQPVRDLVLRDVVRKGQRERQIAQMIDRRLVVQLEAAVAVTPVVADTLFPVDHQRVEAGPLQLDGGGNAGMSAADGISTSGLAVGVGSRCALAARASRARRNRARWDSGRRRACARFADPHRNRARWKWSGSLARPSGEASQPQRRADARAIARAEGEDGLDDLLPGDDSPARHQRRRVDPEIGRANLRRARQQFRHQPLPAADSRKLPGDAEQVSPVAVGHAQFG